MNKHDDSNNEIIAASTKHLNISICLIKPFIHWLTQDFIKNYLNILH